MKRKSHTDKNYKFTKKKHSGRSILALVFSFAPLVLFFYAVAVSFLKEGQAPETIGCVGIASLLAALLTLKVSISEARKENIIKRVPVTGAVMSVLMLVGWLSVYVIGWVGL